MASDVLAVPEEYLMEVIKVIRVGLESAPDTSEFVREKLVEWCAAEEAYFRRLQEGEY